jgi:effector-binding domain-containing protein
MKALKKIGLVLGVIVLLLIVVSFFLPSTVHVERSMEMKCAPEAVFPLVNNLKNWDQWSPWHHKDSLMKKTYGDIFEGQGAYYSWQSEHSQVGNGKLEFVEVVPNQIIKSKMYFMEGEDAALGDFKFEKTESGCKVVWSMDADMSKPFAIGKYFGLMMDAMVGKDFEQGLNELKRIGESAPIEVSIAGRVESIEEIKVPAINLMMIKGESKYELSAIGSKLGEMYSEIDKEMAKQGAKMTGAPCAMYPGFKEGDTDTKIVACMPCSKLCGKCKGEMECVAMPATNAVVAHYYGPYDKTGIAYEKLKTWISENKKEITGEPWEEYANDPVVEKDPNKFLTNIYFPIK